MTTVEKKTIEDAIVYAEGRRDEAHDEGSMVDEMYWSGYVDALKAVREIG